MIADAFTKKRHNRNVSDIRLVHNLFCQGKSMRTIDLNTEYVVLFGNARDRVNFSILQDKLNQIIAKSLMKYWMDATKTRFSFVGRLKTFNS